MEILHWFFQFVMHIDTHLMSFVVRYGAWIYLFLFSIIFSETGLVVTAFFMPGDSLLFAAGAIATRGGLNIYWLLLLLIIAAFLGNVVNYWIGNKLGHLIFRDEKSLFFKKSYLIKTHDFFEKYGAKTIVIARFMPVVRTFAPFVAGMGYMNHFKFMAYNFIGALLWASLLLLGGFWFGNIPMVKNHFSAVVLAIIVVSILPPFIEYIRRRFAKPVLEKSL